MDILPIELLEHIFSFLTIYDLIEIFQVCKIFKLIIKPYICKLPWSLQIHYLLKNGIIDIKKSSLNVGTLTYTNKKFKKLQSVVFQGIGIEWVCKHHFEKICVPMNFYIDKDGMNFEFKYDRNKKIQGNDDVKLNISKQLFNYSLKHKNKYIEQIPFSIKRIKYI
jgi:hypothetical protein